MSSYVQIPNLPVGIALNGTEQFEAVQSGVSVQLTAAQIAAYVQAQFAGVTTFSAAATGLTPSTPMTGPIVLGGTLNPTHGGTGLAAYTAGDLLYASATNTLSRLPIGANGQILSLVAGLPAWVNDSSVSVSSFSAGTTGLTPSSPTTGAIVLAGTLAAANGGTGQSAYAIGDLLYASGATALSKLADVATGNALISGGVATAPSWGKIGLTTHVSGVLPSANGGTGVANTSTVTLGGNFAMVGAFTFAGTLTGNTAVTFPTSGTLQTTAAGSVNAGTAGQLGYYASTGTAISGNAGLTYLANTLNIGGADGAAPPAQTISFASVSGVSNTIGPDTTIQLSKGTGAGGGGSLIVQLAPPYNIGGGTQNLLTTLLSLTPAGLLTLGANAAGAIIVGGGTLALAGLTSGSTSLSPAAVASGALTLPSATDTLVGKATTDVLTNKSISGSTNTITNVSLATGVTGNLPVGNLNGGTGAGATTFWRGDATWAVPTASGANVSLGVGTTLVTGGTSGRVLYDNAGVLGEMTNTGTGTVVVLQNAPTLTTPVLGVATGTSLALGGASLGTAVLAVAGIGAISGNLGVGINPPVAIFGTTVHVNGATGGSLNLTGSTVSAFIAAGDSNLDLRIVTQSSHPIVFFPAGAEKLRIATSGALTAPGSLSLGGATIGTNTLAVTGTTSLGLTQLTGIGVGTTPATNPQIRVQGPGTGTNFSLYLTDSATNTVLTAQDNGNIIFGGGSSGTVATFTASTKAAVFSGTVKPLVTTVAGLPAASTAGAGAEAFVTDANTTVILGLGLTVVGGGANKVPVYSDGANWIVG